MSDAQKARERALEDAVSRALRDNLPPLQRTLEDMQQAFADLVSACSSARPTNALPAMLRAQSTAASLSASLSVLSSFITSAMQRRDSELSHEDDAEDARAETRAGGVTVAPPETAETIPPPAIATPMAEARSPVVAHVEDIEEVEEEVTREEPEPVVREAEPEAAAEPEPVAFSLASLPKDEQDLHKRANRVAKVSMQDIKMLKPEDVRKGLEHKDICVRLRNEIDKARKEYDRRFHKILEQPVDYFHHWMVEILGGGDPEALGEYPYPSPVLRR
ncbi:MAG TPA: hypothetical protein VJN90_06610 [Candidatus Acidoferrales bacterium]|nr:hypothetical protein [Candidatus Acidoferrales bacterium]